MHRGTKTLFRGKHLTLLQHQSGWEYVSRTKSRGGVIILAVTTQDRLLLIEQLRHPIGKPVIELPAGLIESGYSDIGRAIIAAAKQELKEESGYTCKTVSILTSGSTLPGITNELNTICYANGLCPAVGQDEHRGGQRQFGKASEGERTVVHEVPIQKANAWLRSQERKGKIIDLKVFAGLYFLNSLWRVRPNDHVTHLGQ